MIQFNSVHALATYFLKTHFNIIVPFMSRSPRVHAVILYASLISLMHFTCSASPTFLGVVSGEQ